MPRVLLLTTRDTWWTTQAEALLEAAGIEGTWVVVQGAAELSVADTDADRVAELLGEQLGEELRRREATRRDPTPRPPLLLQPAFAAAVCSAVILLIVHATVNKSDAWFKLGVMVPDAVRHGEWWRLITAATLHADANHVLHNAAFLVLLGWAAAERIGVGGALAAWMTTAIAGFLVSMVYDPSATSVGASGGLFGLLGAAAGHALRTGAGRDLWLRHRMRVVGALASVLALTAFGEHSNIAAHLGGAGWGVAVGLALPARPLPWAGQAVVAGLTCVLVAVAWKLALASGV